MSYFPPFVPQTTAFGEQAIAWNTPFIQAAPVYGLLPANFRAFTAETGSGSVEDKMFTTQTGTNSAGYGAIQSFRAINYKAGQGALARFTAMFESSGANSWQGVGMLNLSDEFSFGFNGTSFGIWHRYNGRAECRTIQLTAPASASTNLTLTLNSVAYTIPLTSGTVQHNAYEIEAWLQDNQSIWYAEQLDDTVIISANSDGAKSGTYSFSHASATGVITQQRAGVTKTSDFTAQASFNKANVSWLDPTKLNVYQIRYPYLGAGNIHFDIMDEDTGDFIEVHQIMYTNSHTIPSTTNPSMHMGLYCVNFGNTSNLVVRTASMGGYTQGMEQRTRNPRSHVHTQENVGTSFTNILTIRNRRTYNYFINQVEVEPFKMTVSNEGAKDLEIKIVGNPTFSGNTNFQSIGSTELVIDVDETANTVSGGRPLGAYTIAPGQSVIISLLEERIRIPPTLVFTIAARLTSGAAADVTAAITWYEDV